MKVVYFDCFSGISGDMLLGSLLDAGLPLESLLVEVQKLELPNVEIRARSVEKHGISATKVDVLTKETGKHRHLGDVLELLDRCPTQGKIRSDARKIFQNLARAEAEVHGASPETVVFHEIGAMDAIVDVLGTLICLDLLLVERVYASVIRFGRGTTRGAHGPLPIPAPAVVALCKGLPTERTEIPYELVTPTGAAILSTLATEVGRRMTLTTESFGYGAGSRDIEEVPNLLRVEIGQLKEDLKTDTLYVIETNVDDMSPEIYGYVTDRLLAEGARDAYLTPLIMKKGRPGVLVSVLSDPSNVNGLTEILLRETTTLGVRVSRVDRLSIDRKQEVSQTPFGPVSVKRSHSGGRTLFAPEYEDCARIARAHDIPILEVYRAATRAAESKQKPGNSPGQSA